MDELFIDVGIRNPILIACFFSAIYFGKRIVDAEVGQRGDTRQIEFVLCTTYHTEGTYDDCQQFSFHKCIF